MSTATERSIEAREKASREAYAKRYPDRALEREHAKADEAEAAKPAKAAKAKAERAQLQGARELRRRMKAIKTVFKPVGRSWAEDTQRLASSRVRVKSGKTKASIRVKNASLKRASVEVKRGGRFLEAGAQAHEIKAKRVRAMPIGSLGGQPQFAKRVSHPGMSKQPFLHRSAADALARNPMADELIKLWNNAA